MLSLLKGIDQVLNWFGGAYQGVSPKKPRALSTPLFVEVTDRAQSLSELLHIRTAKHGIRFRRPLVVCDDVTWEIAGKRIAQGFRRIHYDPDDIRIQGNSLRGVEQIVQKGVVLGRHLWERNPQPNPLDKRYGKISCGMKRYDTICAVGGGSVIDVAQYAAYRLNLPWISIPTSLAHDGFASQFSVLRHDAGEHTFAANVPLGVLVDISLINSEDSLPRIRAGVGDLLSNITAGMDWYLAEKLTDRRREAVDMVAQRTAYFGSMYVLQEIIPDSFPGLGDHGFLKNLATALIQAGEAMGRCGSSRPCSGFEHKLYHAWKRMGEPGRLQHGEVVAIGALISAAAHGRYFHPLHYAYEKIGLPYDAASLDAAGVTTDDLTEVIQGAVHIKPDRYTILEARGTEKMIDTMNEVYG